jgi:hypothetical protein
MPDPARARRIEVEPQRVVCVLGMHRSGTSVVASLLERLGVRLGGPGDFLRPLPENPRGYWEHRGLKDVNEALLARLGGRWHSPPPFANGWHRTEALNELRTQARALLDEQFGESVLWGWKDPRTCLTLPFWKPLLPEASYIICLRNPFDVARSLHARDDLPIGHGLRLWLTYTAAALAHSAGHPRLFLFYEDVLNHSEETAGALARFIGRPRLSRAAVATLVTPELRHHETPLLESISDPDCPYPVSSLHILLRTLAPRANGPANGPANWPDTQTHETHATHAILNAAAAQALDTQAALDAARGETGWRVTPMSPAGSIASIAPPSPPAVSALRASTRNYLTNHPSLAIAYRRIRRIVRRWLQLGP